MDNETAIALIRELAEAATEMTNTQGGRGFKGAMKREERATKALFIALTGRKPTPEEIKAMLD